MLRVVVIVIVVAAVALAAAGGIFCESALSPGGPVVAEDPAEVALRAMDGTELRAAVRGTGPECALVLHGVADARALGFAPWLTQEGFRVVAPDSRGHGRSGGRVTYGLNERDDVRMWVRWMRQQGCRRVVGIGESMGAAILIQAASGWEGLDALVAECPFATLPDMAAYRLRNFLPRWLTGPVASAAMVYGWIRYGLDLASLRPVDAVRHVRVPLLLIHGLADINIPPDHSRRLHAANPAAELWLVPDARHTQAWMAAPVEFQRRVLAALRR